MYLGIIVWFIHLCCIGLLHPFHHMLSFFFFALTLSFIPSLCFVVRYGRCSRRGKRHRCSTLFFFSPPPAFVTVIKVDVAFYPTMALLFNSLPPFHSHVQKWSKCERVRVRVRVNVCFPFHFITLLCSVTIYIVVFAQPQRIRVHKVRIRVANCASSLYLWDGYV